MHEHTGKLTVGSLFAGIGGFDLGFERTGAFRTAWFCELDPYAQRVLAKHWPGTPCHPDITAIGAHNVEPVDVLCGGFPCQDISAAGRGAGLAGARSGLWSEYARLVRELRPRYVVVENVPPLRKKGLEVVLADLLACGYDAEWDGIPACAVGAPHRRDRIWIVAYPHGHELREQPGRLRRQDREGAALAAVDGEARAVADADSHAGVARRTGHTEQGARGWDADRGGLGAGALADADGCRCERGTRCQPEAHRRDELEDRAAAVLHDTWSVEPDVGRVADGVPARVDRLRCLGNALVPQIAEWIGYRIAQHEGLV